MSNLKKYIKNDLYNINLSSNNIYINNYEKINTINDNLISIKFKDFKLNINGKSFKVSKMVDKEILFNGYIESMEYIYK